MEFGWLVCRIIGMVHVVVEEAGKTQRWLEAR